MFCKIKNKPHPLLERWGYVSACCRQEDGSAKPLRRKIFSNYASFGKDVLLLGKLFATKTRPVAHATAKAFTLVLHDEICGNTRLDHFGIHLGL